MKVSISTLFTLMLLTGITIQAGRIGLQCLTLDVELMRDVNLAERRVSKIIERTTASRIYQQALKAESPAVLLDLAGQRHAALLKSSNQRETLP